MSDPCFKKIQIVGTSANSFDDATRNAIEKASTTVHGISWFEVLEHRGAVKDGKVAQFQVTLNIGFKLDS